VGLEGEKGTLLQGKCGCGRRKKGSLRKGTSVCGHKSGERKTPGFQRKNRKLLAVCGEKDKRRESKEKGGGGAPISEKVSKLPKGSRGGKGGTLP